MDKRLAEIKERAEKAAPGPWEAPLKDLGAVPSFQAVDFYFDESYEAYPPLGEIGPVFVANGRENADFLSHAREDVPYLLDLVQQQQERIANYERWEHGCGDHGCLIEKPQGMGTNGNCRCPEWLLRREICRLKKLAVEQSERIAELETRIRRRERAMQLKPGILLSDYEDACPKGEEAK